MDGQYLPDDEVDIDSLASSEPPEYVPQMFSEGGEVEEEDIEYFANGGEASVQSMNEYLLSDEEGATPEMAQSASYDSESSAPEMNLETARSMMRKLAAKGGGKSSRSKEMSMELSGLVPAIPELGAPQTEQEKLTQIATARAQYDALEQAYKLKAQAAQRAGKGLTRSTFSGATFNQPTLEKAGPLMARTFAKGGEADKKDPEMTGINRVTDFIAQRLPASSFPTSGRTFLETVQGKRDPLTEGNFSPEELAVMKEMIALKGGDKGDIQYGDYQALAKAMRARGQIFASTTPSLFSMSDPLGNVQTTLGRFKYGRDAKGNLVVQDTYDFNPPQDPNSMQEQRTAEYGAMGPYRLIREYAGEKIPPGRGREININLGKPVKRAEGSPVSGERLTPQQIERIAAEQAALNTYQPVMNRNIQRQGERSRKLAGQRDVSTLPDPQTYAFIESALFGTPPDEVANKFGVFHPRRKDILSRAEQGFVTGNVAMVAPAAKMLKDVTAPAVKYLGKEAARQVERGIFNEGPLRGITPQPMYISRSPGGYFPTSRGMGEKTAEEINNTKLSDLPEDFVSWLNTDDRQKASFLGLGPKKESLGDKYNRWKAETGNKDYTFGILSGIDKSFQPVLKKITEMESGEKRDALFQMFNQKAKDFYSKQAGSVQDPLRADILGGNIKFDMDSKMGDVFPQVLVKQAAQGNLQALRLLEKNYDDMLGIKAVVPYRRVPSRPDDIPPQNTLKRQIIESVRDNIDTIPDSQLLAYAGKKPLPGPDGVAKAAKEVRLKLKENPNLFSTILEPNIERTVFAKESRYSDLDLAKHPNLYGTTATEAMINPQGPAFTKDQLDAMDALPSGYFLPELETAINKSQPILDAQEYGNLRLLGLNADKLLQEANRLSAKDLNSMGFTDFLKKAYKSSEELAQIEKDLKRVKPLLQQGKPPPANVMLFGVKDFLPTVNDMRWVKVTNPEGVKSIAAGMNNSVGSYATSETYGALGRGRRALDKGEVEVYALYDKNHTPHVTVEYGTGKSSVPEKQRSQILQLTGNGPLTANEASNNYAEQIAALVNALPIKDVTALPASTQKVLKNNFFEFKDNRVVRNEEEFTKNQGIQKELGLAKGGSVDKNIAFIKAHT
jgi:hypothetical protein